MRAAATLLLATVLIATGCLSDLLSPSTEIRKSHTGGQPGLWLILQGDVSPAPVVVVKTHVAREEFAVATAAAAGSDPWRSLADRLYREEPGTRILLAYPDERRRPPAPSDPGRRSIRLVFIGGDERVVADRTVTLEWARTLVDPGAPFRYLVVLRPDRPDVPTLAPGTVVRLPAEAKIGVEPEWRPFQDSSPRRITVKGIPLEVEIADTAAKRSQGLMYRDVLPEGSGMLFLYPDDDVRNFWMVNTRIALDVAYLDAEGVIRSIRHLQPHDPVGKASSEPVRMALEVPAGWFARHGVAPGDRVATGVSGRE